MTDPNPPPPGDLSGVAAHNADVTPRPTRPPLAAPLRLKTADASDMQSGIDAATDAQPTSAQPAGTELLSTSPKTERLPSFRHISKIADAAGEDASRPAQYPPPPQPVYPPPPIATQSPILPHQPYPQTNQISPVNSFGFPHQTSPSSIQSDAFYPNSPPSTVFSAPHNGYNPRRQSFPITSNPLPPALGSMTTGSSSGDSYGHHSSLGDISTNQTTPLETNGHHDATGRPKYSLLPNVHGGPGGGQGPWYCDHPGCNASPFPTQYLLNSHATSHSPHRPHYCPVAGCPRGEGGKGFKRKNEMIRHGLTHNTPGYVCPFCPDRGHKYPRPDNLQRHVRVHHVDKDRDDPILREVLSQRAGGGSSAGRGRRRRTGP
ncbi:hypothetical protein K461DRAFT_290936 [Myriangium duriaei CBS 260.36]|uniref:C2H2-type domain-containing protein n=1 Tax=Myriangium duriaei CBS 260.36 TaxID=1168546 RepID=A0A9P4MQV4_9PEZI|nr:hypothetical protein K461DRAFT_290936 [Myriangium duriaei CBS 260.36]